MKAVVERGALLKVMGRLEKIVERRNTIPILSNVRIEAIAPAKDGEGMLRISATDLDLLATCEVPATVEAAGATTVAAFRLKDLTAALPEGCQISLALNDGRLTAAAARSRYTLPVLPAEDFPVVAFTKPMAQFSLSAKALAGIFADLRSAISTEEVRYYLNGICMAAASGTPLGGAGGLRFVATNGHIGKFASLTLPEGGEAMPRVIIPAKACATWCALAEELGEGEVGIAVDDKRMRFEFAGGSLLTKLIDGDFPDADPIVPTRNDNRVTVDPVLLGEAIRRAIVVAGDKARGVKLSVETDLIRVSCTSAEHGTAEAECPAEHAGDDLVIGFNSRYLNDVLAIAGDGPCEIALADAGAPTLFRAPGEADRFAVAMPLRV